MTRKKVLILLGSVCLALMLALPLVASCAAPTATPTPTPTPTPTVTPTPTPTAEKVFHFRNQCAHAPEEKTYKSQVEMAEYLRDISNGRIDIECFPENAIVGVLEAQEAVSSGAIEMAMSSDCYLAGSIPACAISDGIVASWRGPFDAQELFWKLGFLDEVREACAKENLYYFRSCCVGENTLWATKPIVHLEDVKDLKLRSYGAVNTLWEKLGASAVFLPHSESYVALATGTINGYFTTPTVAIAYKHYEICPYLHVPALHTSSMNNIINMDVWNELPDDLKAMFELAMRWSFYDQYYRYNALYEAEIKPQFEIVQYGDDLMDKIGEVLPSVWEGAVRDAQSERMLKTLEDFARSRGYIS